MTWHPHSPKFWKLNLNHEIDPLHILIRVLHKLHSLITLVKQETRKEDETLKNVQILYLQKLPHSMEPMTSINSTSLFLVFKNPLKFIRSKRKKRKLGRKAQISIREREKELRELSRIVCYSKHNGKMYISTPFVKFYNWSRGINPNNNL